MTSSTSDEPTPRQTTWQRRVASFQDAVRAGWRSYRLAPWLFERAGQTEVAVSSVQAFGSTELYPSEWFAEERVISVDGMGREWGEQIGREETRAFLSMLSARTTLEPATEDLANQLDRVLERVARGSARYVAIIAPARWRVLQGLQLQRDGDVGWLPGEGARALFRGTFNGLPVFSPQQPGATDLWVIDFERVARWQYVGGFDDLLTSADLLRDQFVRLNGVPVPATRITAEEFFGVALDDLDAAAGIRIPLDASS